MSPLGKSQAETECVTVGGAGRRAAFCRQATQWLTTKARYHEEVAAMYEKSPLPFEGKLPYGAVGLPHCRQFTELYRAQARQAESLAVHHEEMARAAELDQTH